jgi:flagellar basal-body rod protein FlgB
VLEQHAEHSARDAVTHEKMRRPDSQASSLPTRDSVGRSKWAELGRGDRPTACCTRGVPVNLSTLDTLQASLTFHRERHTVLAGNIANLDTPGYKPLDLQRTSATQGTQLAVTTAGHIASSPSNAGVVTSFNDGNQLQGPDGNAVELERELSKIDANRARYATTSELTSRRIALLRYAAGDGT